MSNWDREELLHQYRISMRPSLKNIEKETVINLCKVDEIEKGVFFIESFQSHVIRSLMKNKNFVVIRPQFETIKGEKVITGITGTLPIGCLGIKKKPRKSNEIYRIFSR